MCKQKIVCISFYIYFIIIDFGRASKNMWITSLIGICLTCFTTSLPSDTARSIANQRVHVKGKELVDTASMCLEPGCIHAASALLEKMSLDVDPCQDFYEFACGRFTRVTFIPDEKIIVNTFGTMSDKLDQQLRIILEEKVEDSEILPFKQAKAFYQTCMNKTNIAKMGEEPLLELFQIFGGLPVIEGEEWDESKFKWAETVKKFRQKGVSVDYLIDLSISPDIMSSTRRHIEVRKFL